MSNNENDSEISEESAEQNKDDIKSIPVVPLNEEEFSANLEQLYRETISNQDLGELLHKNRIDANNAKAVAAFKHNLLMQCLYEDSLYALDKILEEDTAGFAFFQSLCDFEEGHYKYMSEIEGPAMSVKLPGYIALRLEKTEVLSDLSRIAQNAYDALNMLSDNERKMSFFDAGNATEKLEADIDILPDNTRAKVYFLLAKGYQKANSSPYESKKANREEIDYLNKTLTFASDYKLIFAAQKRLGKDNLDEKIIVGAYKRALKETKDKKNLFRINHEIARLYSEFSQVSGFVYAGGTKEKSLGKAEHYYYQALHYADKESRLNILRNIAAIQHSLGYADKWLATKTEIAMKHLKGTERCKALIKIASQLPKQQAIPFYERVITEAKKSKISLKEKADIIQRSCQSLETLYDDPKKITCLKTSLAKYQQQNTLTPPLNILDRYKLKKGKDL